MTLGNFVKNVPDLWRLALNHLFRTAHRVHIAKVFQPADDEWLEKHKRHLLWQTALMQLQLRADDDNRATRVIDAFTEEVLAETATLALEHVAERFERPVASARHGATMSAVIEQSVHRFLEHSFFIANDHVGRLKQKQVLEPVVAVDHPPIKIVQVRGRKTPAFEGN